ncbi:transmembrane acyltransferase [Mycobacteroides abscessus subsp. abscessus]|nr:transmembrane acyltransferase [Mycobacteroides abscessus subsp. abscessus]
MAIVQSVNLPYTACEAKPANRLRLVICALVCLVVGTSCSTSSGGGTSPSTTAHATKDNSRTYATTADVIDAVRAAQESTTVPESVASTLTASDDTQPPHQFDCRPIEKPKHADYFGDCATGDEHGSKLMVVYGDSHASMWLWPLASIASKSGWKLRLFSLGGCPAPDLQFLSSQTLSPNTDCDAFHASAMSAISALHPDLIVVSSYSFEYEADRSEPTRDQWQRALESAFRKLAAPGTRMAMIGNIPQWGHSDARCLAAHLNKVQACSAAVAEATPRNLDAERAATESVGGTYVSTTNWVCAERCEPVIADLRVYSNEYHFTRIYTEYLTGALRESLEPVLR